MNNIGPIRPISPIPPTQEEPKIHIPTLSEADLAFINSQIAELNAIYAPYCRLVVELGCTAAIVAFLATIALAFEGSWLFLLAMTACAFITLVTIKDYRRYKAMLPSVNSVPSVVNQSAPSEKSAVNTVSNP
jgi:hypothetical protein